MISAILLFSSFISFAGPAKAAKLQPATPKQNALILETEEKYQRADAITMSVDKVDKVEALDQTRSFSGTLLMKKGKFRLELQSKDTGHDTSLIVADGKNVWLVTPPPKEFKDAKTQVAKFSMSDKRAQSHVFLQMLTEGGLLKIFKVTGVNVSDGATSFFMEPKKTSAEFRRAVLVINEKNKTIDSLQYWDAMSNETHFSFLTVDFQKPIADGLLSYKPPKDVDVMTY